MRRNMSMSAILVRLRRATAVAGLLVGGLLAGCALPERANAPRLYDFGPPREAGPVASATKLPVLALRVQASPALDSHALHYRLAYADAQQLLAYSQSRWAMTPAELLQQRLREGLTAQYALLPEGESASRLLHIELEEFSQLFTGPAQSQGQLRLRATLLQRAAGGERLLAQREWRLSQPATPADASGGVRALRAATDLAVTELVQWLQLTH